MKRNVLVLIVVIAGFTLASSAGTISGQVSGFGTVGGLC